ncbi:hypothetical protein KC19_3G183000 [Ceratodon purpureus]|uniref:Uncharacterized protein n=1 Tax=Ceratodon purpureus TaxID=3225 RepID=A0A8T0IJW0_CERPU|nr:hypothetical protein KC19_3G183000 [Ceratodon purpureus]
MRSITMPLPLTSAENQAAPVRTTSRAQALLVEMVQQSRFSIPGAQQHGLTALATELPPKQKSAEVTENGARGEGEDINYRKEDITQTEFTEGVGKSNNLQEDDVTQIVITEVSEPTEPRFITPKEVSLFDDWRPGSKKIDKPPSVDENHWLRVEMEKQHELRLAQKKATRTKELRNLRRFEGAGVDDTNDITPPSIYSSQLSIANFVIKEDIEESVQGYAKFLYRPGAAWKNLGSDSASSTRTSGPLETEFRSNSWESRKSTTELVQGISSASARREAMRKELAERLREDLLRKKLLISQNRAAARAHSSCRCC